MTDIKKLFSEKQMPSKVFRHLLDTGECNSLQDIIVKMIETYPEIPITILNTITRWNRGNNPERAGQGLSDEKIDEIILELYGEMLID